jgi:hypothetical protein
MDCRPWIILVGGFLGAGKTTLILAAAKELKQRGLKPAMIWNDQGIDLVDSRQGALFGADSGEVTGGCFCCRLTRLIDAMSALRAYAPDVIFAEPVGSCTDLAATVLRPLLEYSDDYRLAPFTVLIDPHRARALSEPDADPDMRFLFDKQWQEADLICLTKSDLDMDGGKIALPFAARGVRRLSAKSGQGVAAWLEEVMSSALSIGNQPLEIDYSEYARAEAALAWLNLRATFEPPAPLSPALLLGPLLDDLDAALTARKDAIAHLKAIVTASTGWVKAAICANGQEPAVEGNLDASPASRLELVLNLRVVGDPPAVRAIVEHALGQRAGLKQWEMDCFSPAAPTPERRIAKAG